MRPAINVGILYRGVRKCPGKSYEKSGGYFKDRPSTVSELAAFSKFGGDMDAVTAMVIDKDEMKNSLFSHIVL